MHTCVHVCMEAPLHSWASRGQRLMLGCLPQLLPHLIFWTRVPHWISSLPIWLDCPGICPPPSPSTRVQRTKMPGFYAGAGDLNFDPHAHTANTLPTECSLQPLDPICLNTHRYNSVPESLPVYKYATISSATEHWNLNYIQFLCDSCCFSLAFFFLYCCFLLNMPPDAEVVWSP